MFVSAGKFPSCLMFSTVLMPIIFDIRVEINRMKLTGRSDMLSLYNLADCTFQ
jgi:hypothetical protein